MTNPAFAPFVALVAVLGFFVVFMLLLLVLLWVAAWIQDCLWNAKRKSQQYAEYNKLSRELGVITKNNRAGMRRVIDWQRKADEAEALHERKLKDFK